MRVEVRRSDELCEVIVFGELGTSDARTLRAEVLKTMCPFGRVQLDLRNVTAYDDGVAATLLRLCSDATIGRVTLTIVGGPHQLAHR